MIRSLRTPGRNRRRSGVTLLETLIAVSILVVGLVNAVMMAVRCSRLQQTTAEYVQAHNAARNVVERLRDVDLDGSYAFFTANPTFNMGDQQVEVSFDQDVLVDALGSGVPAGSRFVDQDGDGVVDLNAASTDAFSLLPVRITVRHGALRLELVSLLTEK